MYLLNSDTGRRGRRRTTGRYRMAAQVKGKRSKRGSGGGGERMRLFGAIVLLLFVLAGLGAALFAGFVFLRDTLFAHNDRFTIEKIEIVDGQIKTEDMIREYLAYEGIKEGSNLFGFNLKEFERDYLKRNPLVKSIQLTRVLPDTLHVAIRERDPLARLRQRGTLVTDGDGFVFRLSSKLHRLPVIIGCKDPELGPGKYVKGMTKRAVEVLSFCDNPRVGIRIVGIDVSHPDYLLMHIFTPDGIKQAPLSWDDMERGLNKSIGNLEHKLNLLKQAIRADRGRNSVYDATYSDRIYVR